MHIKLSLDLAGQQLAAVQQQAAGAQAAADDTAQELLRAQQCQDVAVAAAAELAAAEQEVHTCWQLLGAQQAKQADVEAQLGRLQTELAAKRRLLQSMQAPSSGTTDRSLAAKAALQSELARLAEAATTLEKQAASAAAGLAAAEGHVAALEAEWALCPVAGWEEELSSRQRDLTAATAALQSRRTELAAQSAELATMQEVVERASAQLAATEQAAVDAMSEAADQRVAAEQAAAEQVRLQSQLEVLLREVPELGPLLQVAAGGRSSSLNGGDNGSTLVALKQSCLQLAQRRSKLLLEQRGSAAVPTPLAEQLASRERQAGLAAARRQAETLRLAAQRLQEGMAASDGQVRSRTWGWAVWCLHTGIGTAPTWAHA
jgi:chromosome segregation ATPase